MPGKIEKEKSFVILNKSFVNFVVKSKSIKKETNN
jgi:hypothetical protein